MTIFKAKNVHIKHLEDSIIDGGVDGTRQAINYLRSFRDMLAGNRESKINVTTKIDGAPSLLAGIVPKGNENAGKFFVAKKGVFNVNPKYYTTEEEIDADTKGDLNLKLKLALRYLPELGIKDVVQGDFLYSKSDIKKNTIDGESYITVHPNTIIYAVPEQSDLARQIRQSSIGVAWHTIYRGSSFETMSASFGEEIATKFKDSKNVWSIDTVFRDVSGTATFTEKETQKITSLLSDAGKIFSRLGKNIINGISENEERRIRVNTFINSKIRQGERVRNPVQFVDGLIEYIEQYYQKEADKKKTEKGKKTQYDKRDAVLSYFKSNRKSDIVSLFELYNLIVDTKHMVVRKLDNADGMKTFLKTKNGYEVTGQEGFVAIDHLGQNALKLVDRMSFSRANFDPSYIKGWQR